MRTAISTAITRRPQILGRAVPQMLDLSPFDSSPFDTALVNLAAGPAGAVPAFMPFENVLGFQRSINDIVAQVTVEEDHEDDLIITEHPVEYGAAITDHAYKRPSEVRVRVGWTSAGSWSSTTGQPMADINDVRQVYDQILALQVSRIPFTVVTGKRTYINMLVASVRVHTDARFETTLLADISLREILLVSTVTIPGINPGAQANNFEGPTVNNGQKQVSPASITDQQITGATGVGI